MYIIDRIVALLFIVLLAPLCLVICLVLLFTGEGKVFYKQLRLGKGGKYFKLVKFATMLENSPNIGTRTVTVKDDPRILPVGRFLRRSKINELPQLINIAKGEMRFIGPRPLTQETFSYYQPGKRDLILSMPPGLSGVGSIIFRDEESLLSADNANTQYYQHIIAPYKQELEEWYICNRTNVIDLVLVFLTVLVIFLPKNRLIFKIFPSMPKIPD